MINDESHERMLTLLDGIAGKARYCISRIVAARGRGPYGTWAAHSRSSIPPYRPIHSNCVIVRGLHALRDDDARHMAEICARFHAVPHVLQ
jgi:hypothetical protein